MELRSMRAAEVAKLARKFRLRAAEAEEGVYRTLMLRTALELEELVSTLTLGSDGQFVVLEGDEEEDALS